MSSDFRPQEIDWAEYLSGTLPLERQQSFETWLSSHPEEASEMRALQELDADLSLFPSPEIEDHQLEHAHSLVMQSSLLKARGVGKHGGPDSTQRALLVRLLPWTWAPAAVAALFIGLLLGGRESMFPHSSSEAADMLKVDGGQQSASNPPQLGRRLDVQDLVVDNHDGVRILLKETSSYEVNGTTADVRIQNTLSYIVRNDQDPARRQTAIQLLERHCNGQDVCQVLVYAMTQDPSALVRREAAIALKDDQQDPMVKQSFYKMLVEDPSLDLRKLAESALTSEASALELGR